LDVIRALAEDDLEAYVALRRRSLEEAPLAFAASPESDLAASPNALREQLRRAPEWMLFGAFAPGLVGAAGVLRPRHVKAAHKMHVWGMYVLPEHRGRGIAAELVAAIVRHARSVEGVEWVGLGVTDAAGDARRVYARAGFVTWGREEDALRHGGRSVAEEHMALRL
jgi:GNAT superfamily N-acetyltransferase